MLLGLAADLPTVRRDADGNTHPTALAVLFDVPIGLPWHQAYEGLTRSVLEVVGLSATRSVVANQTREQAAAPFRLPFDVVTTLPDQNELTAGVRRMLGNLLPNEVEYAVRVRPAPSALLTPTDPGDVLVTSTLDLLRSLPAMRSPAVPRLIVADDSDGRGSGLIQPDALPAGISVITFQPRVAADRTNFVLALLREFTHDLPLHEATATAVASLRDTDDVPLAYSLYTSASGLDRLRLSTAFEQFQERTRDLQRYLSVGAFAGPAALEAGVRSSELVDRAAGLVREARNNFMRESSGLSEMARAEAARAVAEPDLRAMEAAARAILRQPDLVDDLAATQHRRVNIWISEDLTQPSPLRFDEINERTALARGQTYNLNVGIGLHTPTDLVDPGTPPVDPILPPTPAEGHVLDVAVFSDSARIDGPAAQKLRLGRIGPTDPVTFRVRMPHRQSSRIRVLISFRQHIVQAFTLYVKLGAIETYSLEEPALRAELEFSRQSQLRDLDAVPPRLLCVAANEDSSRSTHRLMFGSSGESLALTETLVTSVRKEFRAQLADAFDHRDSDGSVDAGSFDRVVKSLARVGRDRWGSLYDDPGASDTYVEMLDRVSNAEHGTVQVLRLDHHFAFPWSALYDWRLPDTVRDMKNATVCRGRNGSTTCDCGPTTGGVCVRGFWGIRLVIEELMSRREVDECVDTVQGGLGSPAVLSTVGVTGDAWADAMVKHLAAELGEAGFEDLTAETPLLPRMWETGRRPAVLVVVGHLTKTPKPDEPPGTRIYIRAAERWLDTEGLREARRKRAPSRWTQPQRPIVLLLGCDTGSSGLDEVFSFVNSLTASGAAAIVATEEKIDTSLAGSLAATMVPALGTVGVGEGLRDWRAQLMAEGNPLGLLFTCFGSAEAHVPALAATSAGKQLQEATS
ncbi:hypothetical protein [Kribbella sp. NPDC049227]|uniref:hypothetical protein n=1 Tax=Kribbella sp. NPDC049227 TaxID=3364113 RepID=UPI0037247FA6